MERKNLWSALFKAQSQIPTIEKSKTVTVKGKNGQYQYKFAPYSAIVEAVKKPLAQNELCYFHIRKADEGGDRLYTILAHASGETIETSQPVPAITNPQDYGSWLTYMRRYQLSSLLGLATDEDVDASGVEVDQYISNELVETYIRKEIELDINPHKFLPHVSGDPDCTSITTFPANKAAELIASLESVERKKIAAAEKEVDDANA